MAPSGHRRNLHPVHKTVIRAVLVASIVPIKLVGPNTAVFGIITVVR